MAAATNTGLINGKEYKLKIGSSFQPNKARESYHLMRYDFKPASIDNGRAAEVVIGSKNECTVNIPNGQDSGITTYKGGKKPAQKDCILIIDKETGEITLEKISSMISLKKSRVERTNENNAAKIAQIKSANLNKNSKNQTSSSSASHSSKTLTTFSSTHSNSTSSPSISQNSNATIPSKTLNVSPSKPANTTPAPSSLPQPKKREKNTISTSDSYSSSSDSDSDSGGELEKKETESLSSKPYEPPPANKSTAKMPSTSSGSSSFISTLQTDLHLTDSDESDSD